MTVLWTGVMADGSTPNRFADKHLHLVDAHYNVDQMKQEGLRILQERNSFVIVQNKKTKYGMIKPKKNTLVVTNAGGLATMESWIDQNVHSSGEFSVPVNIGVVVQNWYEDFAGMNMFSDEAKIGGLITVEIDVTGHYKRVYHMANAEAGIELQGYKMNKGGVSFIV